MPALAFLVSAITSLILFVLTVRLMLSLAHLPFSHPAVLAISQLTRRIITPLKRIFPNFRSFETATFACILLVEILLSLLVKPFYSLPLLLLYALSDSIRVVLQGYFYLILVSAILSWIQPFSPVTALLADIAEPVMRPIRRWIPRLGSIDISPIPALIGLQFLMLLLP